MPGTRERNIKILGAAWLVFGGLAFAIALVAIGQVIIDSSDDGLQGLVIALVLVVLGSVQIANGLALLRHNPVARPLLAISSLILIIPSVVAALGIIGIPFLVVVVASLWLTLSKAGKKAFESYMARENG